MKLYKGKKHLKFFPERFLVECSTCYNTITDSCIYGVLSVVLWEANET